MKTTTAPRVVKQDGGSTVYLEKWWPNLSVIIFWFRNNLVRTFISCRTNYELFIFTDIFHVRMLVEIWYDTGVLFVELQTLKILNVSFSAHPILLLKCRRNYFPLGQLLYYQRVQLPLWVSSFRDLPLVCFKHRGSTLRVCIFQLFLILRQAIDLNISCWRPSNFVMQRAHLMDPSTKSEAQDLRQTLSEYSW